MKTIKSIAAAALLVLAATSCGILGSSASTTPAASTASSGSSLLGSLASAALTGSSAGQNSGAALKSLYGQYKADGKVDMGNITNIMNMATLVNGIQGLKTNNDKSSFYADFAKGLVLGSGNLVTNKNSNNIMGALTNMANTDLSAITKVAGSLAGKASSTSAATQDALKSLSAANSNVNSAVNSLGTIFSMFK